MKIQKFRNKFFKNYVFPVNIYFPLLKYPRKRSKKIKTYNKNHKNSQINLKQMS
jgi:hypothetical protein